MNPIEWALCQSRFYRCQHRFKNVVFHRFKKCRFSAVTDVGFHRPQLKNNGALSFFTGLSMRIVRCFFLGMLLAFQFVIFHAVRVSGNLQYSGMMDQSFKNGCCHGTVLKKYSPFGKGGIGCQDGRMHLVP